MGISCTKNFSTFCRWQTYLATVGVRLGLVGNIACAFLFIPVIRGSSLLPLVGLTSESSIRYHLWIGHIVMLLFAAHGVCFLILWAATNNLSQVLSTLEFLDAFFSFQCYAIKELITNNAILYQRRFFFATIHSISIFLIGFLAFHC